MIPAPKRTKIMEDEPDAVQMIAGVEKIIAK